VADGLGGLVKGWGGTDRGGGSKGKIRVREEKGRREKE